MSGRARFRGTASTIGSMSAARAVPTALILVTVMLWVVVGCTAPAPDDASEVEQTSTTAITVVDKGLFGLVDAPPPEADELGEIERSPLEELLGFETDPERLATDYRLASDNRLVAIERCMRAEGFDGYEHERLDELPTPEMLLAATPSHDLARYGYGPIAVIRSRFEGIETTPTESTGPSKISQYLDGRPNVSMDALYRAINRCVEDAWTEHPPPARSYPEQLAEEVAQLHAAAQQSIPVQQAWEAWSRCMREQGYEVGTRPDARALAEAEGLELFEQLNAWAERNYSPTPSDRERFAGQLEVVTDFEHDLADADLTCAARTEVDRIAEQAVAEAEQRWIDRNGARVELVLAEIRSGGDG